jgi:hypothetical protein
VEYHHVIDAVDELRPEVATDHGHHRRLHGFIVFLTRQLLDHLAAQVGGHHDHRVAEIHRTPLAIGQAPVIEHLQQYVEHIRVRLFHLVEQDHGIRLAPHCLGQVTALFIPDIAGRCTDQACHGMLLHELRHVDTHHGLLGIEQEAGQRLGQLGLADTGRAEKQERAIGPVRVGQTGARTTNRIGHHAHRFALADHAPGERFLHAQQLVAFAFEHLGHRDAGPLGHHLGNFLVGHLVAQQLHFPRLGDIGGGQLLDQLGDASVLQLGGPGQVTGPVRRIEFHTRTLQLFLDVAGALHRGLFGFPDLFQVGKLALQRIDLFLQRGQAFLRCLVRFLLERLALDLELDQAPFQPVQFFRLGIDFHTDAAGRLIDQVDGLVRQLAVSDIAV